MKFDSITDMYKFFGSVPAMQNYINKRLAVHKTVVPPKDYIEHTILKRNVTINGFTLKEIDAFVEGQLSIINEIRNEISENPTYEAFQKWYTILTGKELQDEPDEPVTPSVTVVTIDDTDGVINEEELNDEKE